MDGWGFKDLGRPTLEGLGIGQDEEGNNPNGARSGGIQVAALIGFDNAWYPKGDPVVNHFQGNAFACELFGQKRCQHNLPRRAVSFHCKNVKWFSCMDAPCKLGHLQCKVHHDLLTDYGELWSRLVDRGRLVASQILHCCGLLGNVSGISLNSTIPR